MLVAAHLPLVYALCPRHALCASQVHDVHTYSIPVSIFQVNSALFGGDTHACPILPSTMEWCSTCALFSRCSCCKYSQSASVQEFPPLSNISTRTQLLSDSSHPRQRQVSQEQEPNHGDSFSGLYPFYTHDTAAQGSTAVAVSPVGESYSADGSSVHVDLLVRYQPAMAQELSTAC